MKITQLEYFCMVARHRSITQAARQLYVTQPAVSNAIRELEKEFSINLFSHNGRHLTLTREGEIFYQKAEKLLAQIHETSAQLKDLGRFVPPVRIGIPPILSALFFPKLLLHFQTKYPEIPVQLFEYGSIKASNLVAEDILDAAIVNMNYDINKFNYYCLTREEVLFCVWPEHNLYREKKVSAESLKNEPVILYNTDSVQNKSVNAWFASCGIQPNVILYSSQIYTIKGFVQNHLGGAFLYKSMLRMHPDLTGIPLTPPITQEIGLIWKKGKYINGSMEKFISFIQKSSVHNSI